MASITTDEWIEQMMKDMDIHLDSEEDEEKSSDNKVDYDKLADVIINKMNKSESDESDGSDESDESNKED